MISSATPDYTVLIPAYNPPPGLASRIAHLAGLGVPAIVVVDDGSDPATHAATFAALPAIPRVTLLRHEANLGKGAALKTGLASILQSGTAHAGIVTADADGQHLPDDILRVARDLQSSPRAALVVGARQFAGPVPLRSRLGNVATRHLVRLLTGLQLTDTQTGLRGIPLSFAATLLNLRAGGYAFELEMLLTAWQQRLPIREVPIHTVYENNNASSHFRPLVDSARIYATLFRVATASLFTPRPPLPTEMPAAAAQA
jgi:glycosyltransferase involved in cell wall biosynthesis